MADSAQAAAASAAGAVAASAGTAAIAASKDAAASVAAAAATAGPSALQLQVSSALGLLVSGGSALCKLPQLVSIVRTGSTAGVSLSMYSLELFTQSIAVLYHRAHGFPVATYGENLTLGGGNVLILLAFAAVDRQPRALASLLIPLLLAPLTRFPSALAALQSLSIPLNIAAKLPQIRMNQRIIAALRQERDRLLRATWAQKQTQVHQALPPVGSGVSSHVPQLARTLPGPAGLALPSSSAASAASAHRPAASPAVLSSSLSSVPFVLNLCGSVSRLFTTVTQLSGDRVMLAGFVTSILLNAAIIAQCHAIRTLQKQCREAAQDADTGTVTTPQQPPPHATHVD